MKKKSNQSKKIKKNKNRDILIEMKKYKSKRKN